MPAWGPAKYVARLRAMQMGDARTFLTCKENGGHFAAEGNAVRDAAREYAFLLHAMSGGWR